jgi:hypothetical protein
MKLVRSEDEDGPIEAWNVYGPADDEWIAECGIGGNAEDCARAIAAIPEMLEALKSARRLLDTLLNTSLVHKEAVTHAQQIQPEGWAEIANTRIADWSGRQMLADFDAAIAKATKAVPRG